MPRLLVITLAFLLFPGCAPAQVLPADLRTGHAPLDEKLAKMVTADEHAISASAAKQLTDAVFLDAREPDEYAVSHLPGARLLGYKSVDWTQVRGVDKDRPLVVYCTVGYRSERIARQLRERGFRRVYNLYGSLYAWKLAGFSLEDAQGRATEQLHVYNRKWGALVPDRIGEKIY